MKKTLLSFSFLFFALLTWCQIGYNGQCEGGYYQNNSSSSSSSVYQSTSLRANIAVDFKIYPNPAVDFIQIDDKSAEFGRAQKMNIFNMVGQQVKTFFIAKGQSYDVSDLKQGSYLIQFTDLRGKVLTTRKINKAAP
jgi:hypothetical protein